MGAFARRFGLRFDVGVPHDPFIREKFTRERTFAKKLAQVRALSKGPISD
jgi:hypothetical protein